MPLAEPVLAPRQQLRTGIFPPLVHWSQSLRSLSQHHFSARHARPYGGPSSLSAVHSRSTRSSNCLRRQSVFIIRPKPKTAIPLNTEAASVKLRSVRKARRLRHEMAIGGPLERQRRVKKPRQLCAKSRNPKIGKKQRKSENPRGFRRSKRMQLNGVVLGGASKLVWFRWISGMERIVPRVGACGVRLHPLGQAQKGWRGKSSKQ
jgi:hypothetical protein